MTQKISCDHPKIVEAINVAIELASDSQVSEAIRILADLVAAYPGVASAHAYLGWFLSQIGQQVDAIDQCHIAAQLAPGSEKASLVYFHVLWRAGQQIEALDEMKRFLVIGPSEEYSKIIHDWEPNIWNEQEPE